MLQWLAQLVGLELDAGSGHKVRSSDVCSVGDTR